MYKNKCVFCLAESTSSSVKLTSTLSGCEKVRWAANIRKDEIYDRLNRLQKDELFSYHMSNACYKSYTDKNKVLKAEKNLNKAEESRANESIQPTTASANNVNSRVTRSQLNSSTVCASDNRRCLICGSDVHHRDSKLFRISEESRAERLYLITRYFKDDAFTRTSHIQNPKDLFAADVYHHKNCLRSYERRYEVLITKIETDKNKDGETERSNNNATEPISLNKIEAISYTVEAIMPRLESGEIFLLSKLRDEINENHSLETVVYNGDIKQYLIDTYGSEIEFSVSSNRRKSTLFYSSTTSLDKIIDNLHPESILKQSGKIIKKSLEKVDFNLRDKFCDASSLESSWKQTNIPDEILILFSQIFNFSINDYNTKHIPSLNEEKEKMAKNKKLKIQSLFHIMYYIFKNGSERTPLQVMNGLAIHYNCRSKNLIDSMNHFGLSISYDDVLRIKNSLAAFTLESCSNHVPLPSHFDKTIFTVAAFDNFDHNEATQSGLRSTHDTVSVSFQQSTANLLLKPNISSTSVHARSRSFNKNLACQELKTFNKPTQKIVLSPEISIDVSLNPDIFEERNIDDLAWVMSRMDVSKNADVSDDNKIQSVPTWSAYNSVVCEDVRMIQNTAFLPILPHPVTEFSTVYTAMCNFNDVLLKLDQKYLPLACDEGVYRIARHIQQLRPQEFSNLFLMLGDFHLTKILTTCIGKYLKESGIDLVFIETETFGINVVEQILNGTHYARSTKGFLLLDEALQRLQIEAFFNETDITKYNHELSTIEALQDAFNEKSLTECKSLHKHFIQNSAALKKDFQDFIRKRSEESPAFKYGNKILALTQLLRNSIRADRTGNFKMYVNQMKVLLPIILIFGRTNYMHWLPLYYYDLSTLADQKPELYEEFEKNGNFVVKKSVVPFTSVAIDQALEQSINRSQKSSKGIIGCTQQKEFVTAWNLNHHEMMAINNSYRIISNVKFENDELQTHHEFSPTTTERSEEEVDKIMQYMISHGNLFQSGKQPLKNFATEELATTEACKALLNIFETSCEEFHKFWRARIIEKKVSMSDPIPKFKLPDFKSTQTEKSAKSVSKMKQDKVAHKIVDIAKERNYDLQRLFSFELTHQNNLFNDDGSFRKETSKADLINLLEKKFAIDASHDLVDLSQFTLVVDVMLICRQVKWSNLTTFKDFVDEFCSRITYLIKRGVHRIDIVFDSYVKNSIKIGTRQERYHGKAIELRLISEETPIPKLADLFWGSDNNKTLLQTFFREYILKNGHTIWPGVEIICSATTEIPSQSNVCTEPDVLNILQRSDIEESDSRIIIHIYQACSVDVKKVLVLSSDTDVIVLLLYYWIMFQNQGLQELWVRAGAAKTKRFIPIHILASKAGIPLCSVLPSLHHLTGADYTSKVGTKHGGLESKPENYLQGFGQGFEVSRLKSFIDNAEKYLVQVLRRNHISTTFDDLRYQIYHFGSAVSILDLPPTSNSIRLHILRALYVTQQQINLLKDNCMKLDPLEFGYILKDDILLPERIMILYPSIDELVPNCNCTTCSTKLCGCRSRGLPCISFCKCRSKNSCKNPFDSTS